jgi:thymidylate synthase (FAD)
MEVTYLDHLGTDLSVVNAARVSFDKESALVEQPCQCRAPVGTCWQQSPMNGPSFPCNRKYALSPTDTKLIKYLADHDHWSPFAHPQVSIRVKAPIFVARQLAKHQVGFAWNEVSRRYVDSEPDLYSPFLWRSKADNVKQGSGEGHPQSTAYDNDVDMLMGDIVSLYRTMLEDGVCPEQARMILPQSMYTEWIWTGSLLGWSRVCKLRLDGHTQKETQEVAQMIEDVVKPLFPVSWGALNE